MNRTITPTEARMILEGGFPVARLGDFPYGDLLSRLWNDTPGYQDHGRRVMAAMNHLLSDNPRQIWEGDSTVAESLKDLLVKTCMEVRDCFQPFDEPTKMLFRFAALYHDIGKYIIRERHPTIGWYILEYLRTDDKEELLKLLSGRLDYLELLLIMVRDHDEFGSLCTGEASYPILLNATTSLRNVDEDKKRIVSAIMLLNLADIAGSSASLLNERIINNLVSSWKWYFKALELSKATGQTLEEYVIREASSEDLVIERISRLLIESSRDYPKRFNELTEKVQQVNRVNQLVRNQLRRVYTTHNQRKEFASEFTHVCKLDYGKRFFEHLIEYCEGRPAAPGNSTASMCQAVERVKTETLIYLVFAILRRITSTYRTMIRTEEGVGNLIGVEMKDLTPDNAKEKTTEICKLLLEQHYSGLSWMMSDCPAWFF